MAIAEQMGVTLEKTASSVNIKERLDFSCALFDANGGLIANAPHMPVHLGSMGASVQAVRDVHGSNICEGDAYVVNAPYAGGTHLPDVTLVLPVFMEGEATRAFYAARGTMPILAASRPDPCRHFHRLLKRKAFCSVRSACGATAFLTRRS